MVTTFSFLGLEGQTSPVMGRVVGLVEGGGNIITNSLLMGRFGGHVKESAEGIVEGGGTTLSLLGL